MADVEIATIAGDDDWLELRDGEQGLLRGRLHGDLRAAAGSVIVSTHAWETMVAQIDGGYTGADAPAGSSVTIVVTRTEDGIATSSGDIRINEEQGI